jgi:ribokinase
MLRCVSVVVLGSINADVVLNVRTLPRPGETIRATNVATFPGGKGANQSVAAARMGARTTLIGRVGDDASGRLLRDELEADGIDVTNVHIDPDAPTGTALITVADDGENTIVTSGGANHHVGRRELDALRAALTHARVLLIQLEIPMDVVTEAVALANDAGVVVVLDPAPMVPLTDELLARLDWITPNETEATSLCATEDPLDAARRLRGRGVANAVVTIGERGCVYAGPDTELEIAAPRVDAIDTVACGDAFTGALGARLADGASPADALRTACTAGALAATRAGAAVSLPTRSEVAALGSS